MIGTGKGVWFVRESSVCVVKSAGTSSLQRLCFVESVTLGGTVISAVSVARVVLRGSALVAGEALGPQWLLSATTKLELGPRVLALQSPRDNEA